jgi:dTDP-4-amino-4,6-dideoxygalactose transaminase
MIVPFLSFNYIHPAIKAEVMQAFEKVYDSNWFILGEEVAKFEREYASYNQTKYAVGISNGLDALQIALRVLAIGRGDEVIVPSNTYIATAIAVSNVGALPIFVEPDRDTYNLDPSLIEKKISKNTKCIIPVHLYGQSCEMDRIMTIAKKHDLYVVEDNAQAHGAQFNSTLTGSFGHINATSFYPGKNLGALGDAGGITTDNEAFSLRAAILRNYGSQKKYYNDEIGGNMRLDECQAAILSIKLRYLQAWTSKRQEVASWYGDALKSIKEVKLPFVRPGATHVYHLYVIQAKDRDALQSFLNSKGVGTMIHYPVPPHLQKAYVELGYSKGDFPIAESIASSCLSLPIWPGMDKSSVLYVAEMITEFYN